nr:exo-alpha-sialidase [Clostridia bacterium]
MTNKEWENLILNNKTAVSDTVNYRSSSASISCYDPDNGKIYAVYHASRTNYGESRDVLNLAIIPVAQPHRTETVILCESGKETPDGKVFKNMIDGNCIFMNGTVRIYFISGGTQYFYVDFDTKTKTVSEFKPVLFTYDGKTYELTDTVFAACLDSRGMTGYDFCDINEHIINTNKMRCHDGYLYGCLTSAVCQPVFFRTADGENFELTGIIDKLAKYECQSAILNGRMYCLLRGADGDNFYISDDLGVTFKPCGRLEFNETRPQVMTYKGKLLIAYSIKGVTPNYVRDGRNNMKLICGEGEDLSKYEEIMFIQDRYGIVYYDITDYKGTLYMIFSNADLYLDKNPQAKDLLYYTKIGDLSDYIK